MNIVRQTIQRADPQVIEKLGQAGSPQCMRRWADAD